MPLVVEERGNHGGGLVTLECQEIYECVTPIQGLEYYENLLINGVSEKDDERVSKWVLHKLVEFVPSWDYRMMDLRLKLSTYSRLLSGGERLRKGVDSLVSYQ